MTMPARALLNHAWVALTDGLTPAELDEFESKELYAPPEGYDAARAAVLARVNAGGAV